MVGTASRARVSVDHPFHHSLIGSFEDLVCREPRRTSSKFFWTFYTPDNAVLTIAGDFDPAEARALVEYYFGPIPRRPSSPPLPPMELPPRSANGVARSCGRR